jgi:SiaC family regulatory phosphoprotein
MMELENLKIEPTPKTPQIDFNQLTGNLNLSGRSLPENAAKVYAPVISWVDQYILNARKTTNFIFSMDYYNTASSLWIAKILKLLINIPDPDSILMIHLYLSIEDYDDIEELGDLDGAFSPLTNMFKVAIPSIRILLYGTDDDGMVIKENIVNI